MKKRTAYPVGWCFLLLLTISVSFGCAPKNRGLSDATADGSMDGFASDDMRQKHRDTQVSKRVRDYLAAEDSDPRGQDVLIQTAKTALGTPYVRGGTSTDGFDCSGFVQWTFNQVGVKLPRTAREQSRVGRAVRKVDDMEVGDIVAFHHPKRGYHTGIYVGEGKFIHSPRKRTSVRINALSDPYFSKTFLGARRIGVSSPEDIAAAEKMLAEYRDQEARRAKSTAQAAKSGKGRKSSTVASRESKRNAVTKVAKNSKSIKAQSAEKRSNQQSKQGKVSVNKSDKSSKNSKSKQVSEAPPPAPAKAASRPPAKKDNKKSTASSSSSKQRSSDKSSKSSTKTRTSSEKKSSDTKKKGS